MTESTWFWQSQVSGVAPPGSPPATIPDPTVPSGDLAVGGPDQNGRPPSETYLKFDVSAIPSGSTITSFVVTLPVDPQGLNSLPIGVAVPAVACAPQESWPSGPGPQPFTQKPSDSCAPNAPRLIEDKGGSSYHVDIAAIAEQWTAPGGFNMGVAITNDPRNTSTTYQLTFGPASALSALQATATFAAPQTSGGSQGTTPPTTVPPASTQTAPSSATSPETTVAEPSGPVAVGPTAGIPPASAPPVPSGTPAPTTAGSPEPAASTPASSAPAPQTFATTPTGAGSAPPAGFWIVALLLLVMVAACGYALSGAPSPPEAIQRRGVGRLLAELSVQRSGRSARPTKEVKHGA